MSMSGSAFVPTAIARLPWLLILMVIAIGAFGALALYSVAGGSMQPWALNHIVRFTFFLSMAIAISYVRPDRFKEFALPAYFGVMVLLVLVEMLGFIGGGAQSWLNLGPIRIQPSELMKPVLVLVLAGFYAGVPAGAIRKWSAIWPAALITGVPTALIVIQPDLGTAVLLVLSAITVMFLAGLPMRLFIGGGAAIAALVPIVYAFLLPHQQRRLLIFLNPEEDPLGAGYHITQSKIAIGSGGLFGKGYLDGSQSHLHYLPEVHTDFIFSAMVEEWGMVGGMFLILCFALMMRWGMKVALAAKGRFERLAAAGLVTTIFFYVSINLMMVMGLAPVVGIPIPLFSYGGSAMLTVMICLGILMAIHRDNQRNRNH